MPRKRYSPERLIEKLKENELLLTYGRRVVSLFDYTESTEAKPRPLFIRVGLFIIVVSVVGLPCLLLMDVPRFFYADLTKQLDISFFGYFALLAKRLLAHGIITGLGFILFSSVFRLLITVAQFVSSFGHTYFRELYSDEVKRLRIKLPFTIEAALQGIWAILGGGAVVLIYIDQVDNFWVLFVISILAIIVIYSLIMYTHRRLGRWAFYQLRHLVFPYVLITPISCLLTTYGVLSYLHMTVRLGLWGDTTAELLYPDAVERAVMAEKAISMSQPGRLAFSDAFEAVVLSTAIGLLIVRFLPAIIKKDIARILVIVVGIAGPFIPPITAIVSSEHIVATYLLHVHPALLSVILMLLGDKLLDYIEGIIRESAKCQTCGSAMASDERFCSTCGEKNPLAEK